jgi:hypothetical protein
MTNLVSRLRNYVDDCDDVNLRVAAADEIERLNAKLSSLRDGFEHRYVGTCNYPRECPRCAVEEAIGSVVEPETPK